LHIEYISKVRYGDYNKMNEKEAQDAIQQMIDFIQKEAEDRAAEIKKKADEEFTIGMTKGRLRRERKHYFGSQKENED